MNWKIEENLWLQDIGKKEIIGGVIKNTAICFLISYIFYESFLPIPFLSVIWIMYFRDWVEDRSRKKEHEFRVQFSNSIQSIAAALKTGYSVENAIREAKSDMELMYDERSRIRKEYERMTYQLNMKMSVMNVLERFSERIHQEDVDNFVTVFLSAQSSGGDSISIIKNAIKIISDKIETEKEIEVMLSAKKLEFEIMCIVPYFIIWYMKMTFREFIGILYGNSVGVVIMTSCLVIYMVAYRLGRKLTRIEV